MVLGLGELFAWLRQLMTWLISEAPYPIRAMFWVLLFLSMAGLLNLFFAFNNVCTTDSELYEPNTGLTAVNIQFQRIALANNLNYTLVNSSLGEVESPTAWQEFLYFFQIYGGDYEAACMEINGVRVCEGDNTSVLVTQMEYADALKAQEYDAYVRANSNLKDVTGDEVVGVVCDHENAHLSFIGIDVMNKELWLVLTIFVILAPFLAYAIKLKR